MLRSAALLLLIGAACAQEITLSHITAAVCQIESGCVYNGPGHVLGKWETGGAGEIGYWQVSPMVLRDLKISAAKAKSASGGERIFRLWYDRLYMATGNHAEALAAYHRGLGGRARSDAKDYAQRCLALAERLAKEEQ